MNRSLVHDLVLVYSVYRLSQKHIYVAGAQVGLLGTWCLCSECMSTTAFSVVAVIYFMATRYTEPFAAIVVRHRFYFVSALLSATADSALLPKITLGEALCGTEVLVRHLDGQYIRVKTDPSGVIENENFRKILGQVCCASPTRNLRRV